MKVLHVTNYDRLGGAGIAAFRLHTALRKEGVDSQMLVRTKGSSDPFVTEVGSQASEGGFPKALSSRLAVRGRGWLGVKITRLLGMEGCSLNIFPTGLHKILNASDADVIHLHWVNNEMISIKEIAKINKPIVWTLHDCWSFLGAEHHSDADYWKTACGERSRIKGGGSGVVGGGSDGILEPKAPSPQPPAPSAVARAINRWVFRKKQRAWRYLNSHFVAPSNWMADQVRQSKLFGDAPVKVIPSGLDINVFKPMDQVKCRKLFNFPLDKKLILFGAYNPMDPNKGSDLLEQALIAMPEELRGNTNLVVFGAEGDRRIAELKTHWMGEIFEEAKVACLYNAADVFVCPSRRENLPNTVLEAKACGLPVVAFQVGGLSDLVNSAIGGYLADPFRTHDMAHGIRLLLQGHRQSGGQSFKIEIDEHVDLYAGSMSDYA